MSSISYFFGLTAIIIRLSRSLHLFFIYYRRMKFSVSPTFEILNKYFSLTNKIYVYIFYYIMCFLYFSNIVIDENLFYFNSIVNLINFILILNMHLFTIKKQNQMLLQTLIFFLIYKLLQKLYYKYTNDILFILSSCLLMKDDIKHLRKGIIKNNKMYFHIDELIIEITIGILWLLYSIGYNIICFNIIIFLQLFIRICAVLGYEVILGKIKKDTKIYSLLIILFFIKVESEEKKESTLFAEYRE